MGCGLALAALFATGSAQAREFSVLYAFDGNDGGQPLASPIIGADGNLYGTTYTGGKDGLGNVFQLAPDGTETNLHVFVGEPRDGQWPRAGLIMDGAGNLYGATEEGGKTDAGIIYKLSSGGAETTLYTFCGQAQCADGTQPIGGLIMDAKGNLYGTTQYGGTGCGDDPGCGVVFELTSGGSETVLYAFCGQAKCADGDQPIGGLIADANGNLYGTTSLGGAHNDGTVFKLAPDGTQTVLHAFGGKPDDGAQPLASLIADKKGNLYGTTSLGGRHNDGTIFRLAPDGTETVLYSFKGTPDDGAQPLATLIADKTGNLYGTTLAGGSTGCSGTGCGTIFKVAPGGGETVLYAFCQQPDCTDGNAPYSGVTMDKEGNLYGTASGGGSGYGTIFKLGK